MDRWIGGHGLRAVLILRLAPVVPFNAANVALGTTSVRTRDFVAGTAIVILPGSAAYVTLGSSVTEPGSTEFVAAICALIALTVAAWFIGRRREDEPAPAPAASGITSLETHASVGPVRPQRR